MNSHSRNALFPFNLLPLAAMFLLGGCHLAREATVGEVMQVDPVSRYYGVDLEDGRSRSGQIDCGGGAGNTDAVCDVPYWIKEAGTDTSTRNNTQSRLIILSNEVCEKHLADVFGTSGLINVASSFSSMLLSGAASIVEGRAAQNMSVASSVISGTRSSINSEVYQGLLVGAIIAEIQGLRSASYTAIRSKRTQDLVAYPPAEAVGDALAYHDLCSFYVGVTSLVKKAGRTTRTTDQLVQARIDAKSALLESIEKTLKDLDARIAALESKPTLSSEDTKTLSMLRKQRDDLLVQRTEMNNDLYQYKQLVIPVGAAAAPPATPGDPSPEPPQPETP